ncbi:hypothetical protein EPO05_00725 [Patescibacteria group bacterium]|nr:MAG: hypothetical protein EPO05_00725 [Patescibacteria group bacterium]
MKKIIGMVAALALVFGFAKPILAEEEKEKGTEFSVEVAYFSQYIGPFGATYYDKGVVQADLGFVHPSGFHVDVWGSYSSDGGWNSDFGDELDLIVGVTKTLGPIEIDLGAAYYDLLKVGKLDSEDVYGATLKVSAPETLLGLTPFVAVEVDFPYGEGGVLYQAGISRSFLEHFEASLLANGHNGAFGIKSELVSSARASLSASFELVGIEIKPEVSYQRGFGGDDGMAEESLFWWGVKVAKTF